MKRIIAIMVALVFVLGVAALGLTADKPAAKPAEKPAEKAAEKPADKPADDKCAQCHKGDKALDKVVAKKNIKSSADFVKAVKSGPTAKVHEKFTDADLKAAAKGLKLAE